MNSERLRQILDALPEARIAVLGDFFLDRYLVIAAELEELSVETGLQTRQVVAKRLMPGAAGTVVSNLRALGVGDVVCLGVIGLDGEGFELKRGLRRIGADSSELIESEDRVTPCYTKPMLREHGVERELERIDIKNRSEMPAELEDELIDRLDCLLPRMDAVIVADQVQERNFGVVTNRVREHIARIAPEYPETAFFVDSRVRIGEYRNVMTKPNKYEAVDAVEGDARPDMSASSVTADQAKAAAVELRRRTGRPVFLTAQEDGVFVVDEGVRQVPAVRVEGDIDPVGAGDSCSAGIVSALCAGASTEEAALMGNVVASITVQKIGQTGTASPEEVLARFEERFGRRA